MNSDSEEAKTRKFLEDLIERRRSQPTEPQPTGETNNNSDPQGLQRQRQHQLQQDVEQQLKNQEIQRRRQLMEVLAARQTIGSPQLTSMGSPASASTNFADEALRRVDEDLNLRRSSLGGSFADIMPTNRAPQWGSSGLERVCRLNSHMGGGALYPSLNLNDPSFTAKGVVPWAASHKRKNEHQRDDLRNHPHALSSLAEAVSRETSAVTAASHCKEAALKRHKTVTKVSDLRLKNSQFFMPALPSSERQITATPATARPFMKSYKALWRGRMSVLVSHEVRREIFCRAVARGRVDIQDDSRTLPPPAATRHAG
jgi:hypothetical protein